MFVLFRQLRKLAYRVCQRIRPFTCLRFTHEQYLYPNIDYVYCLIMIKTKVHFRDSLTCIYLLSYSLSQFSSCQFNGGFVIFVTVFIVVVEQQRPSDLEVTTSGL